jgi:hypothetical protein
MVRGLVLGITLSALGISYARADLFIVGLGAQPCAVINASVRPGDGYGASAFTKGAMSWLQGYASGVNAIKAELRKNYFDLSTISLDQQWAHAVDFCRRNPGKDFSEAVQDMMLRLSVISTPQR